jgi:hypothetical protein
MSVGSLVRLVRAYAGWVILAFLVAWPPIHIVLSRRYHFSTWRYGGWGMYATPDGSEREVFLFVSSCGSDTTTTTIEQLSMPGQHPEDERALERRIKDVRSLSRPVDFERLAAWIDSHVAMASSKSLGILVVEPHFDLQGSKAYSQVFGFIREKGRWAPLPMTRGSDVVPILSARLGTCP